MLIGHPPMPSCLSERATTARSVCIRAAIVLWVMHGVAQGLAHTHAQGKHRLVRDRRNLYANWPSADALVTLRTTNDRAIGSDAEKL